MIRSRKFLTESKTIAATRDTNFESVQRCGSWCWGPVNPGRASGITRAATRPFLPHRSWERPSNGSPDPCDPGGTGYPRGPGGIGALADPGNEVTRLAARDPLPAGSGGDRCSFRSGRLVDHQPGCACPVRVQRASGLRRGSPLRHAPKSPQLAPVTTEQFQMNGQGHGSHLQVR